MEKIAVKKVSTGTVFKLIAVGLTFGFLPLFVLFGILGAMGMETLTWNGEAVTGVKAIFAGPLMAVFMALMFTAIIGSITALGLWVYSFIKPVEIEFVESASQES